MRQRERQRYRDRQRERQKNRDRQRVRQKELRPKCHTRPPFLTMPEAPAAA